MVSGIMSWTWRLRLPGLSSQGLGLLRGAPARHKLLTRGQGCRNEGLTLSSLLESCSHPRVAPTWLACKQDCSPPTKNRTLTRSLRPGSGCLAQEGSGPH